MTPEPPLLVGPVLWELPEPPPGGAPPVPGPLLVLPAPPCVVAGEVCVAGGAVGVLEVVDVAVVWVGELVVVEVLVVGVVFVVVWWQSLLASWATVLAPCLRLLVSVWLTDAGRLATALLNESIALDAASHCPELIAAAAWSS